MIHDISTWPEVYVKLKDLKPYKGNPRRITKEAYQKLINDIKEDGYHERILCNANLVVASGNQRLKALKELGYKEIPVLKSPNLLSDEEFKRILVRCNVHRGEWDMDKIANEYDALMLKDWGFPEGLLPDYDIEVDAFEDESEEPKEEKEVCPTCGK